MMKNLVSKLALLILPVLVLGGVVSANAANLGGTPSAQPVDRTAGNYTQYDINFQVTTPLVIGEQINIEFIENSIPYDFNLSSVTLDAFTVDSVSANAHISSISGNTVTLTTDPGTTFDGNDNVFVKLGNVGNIEQMGKYHVVISTSTSGPTILDGPTFSVPFQILPRAPDHGAINPSGSNDIVAGTTTDITATFYDEYDNPTSGQLTGWSLIDPTNGFSLSKATGTTDVNGQDSVTLTAPTTAGQSVTVQVQSGSVVIPVTLTTVFNTIPGETAYITISPNTIQNIVAGDTINFSAIAYDINNNPTGDVIIWHGTSAIDSGLFNNTTMGNGYEVWASVANGTESDHIVVNIDHNVTTQVIINPNTEQTVVAGVNLPFNALAYDAYNNLTGDAITWTGTDASGIFNQTVVGEYNVYATANGVNSTFVTVHVVVVADALHHFILSQDIADQTAGNAFNLTITPYDQYGNVIVNYDWNNPLNRPVLSGLNSIAFWDPSYNFSSVASGVATYTITPYAMQTNVSILATLGAINNSTNVFDVNHANAELLGISPYDYVSMTADQTQQFFVTAYDIYENAWDVTNGVTWYINDFWGNYNPSMGYFTGNTYNAVGVGTWYVHAYYDSALIPWTCMTQVDVSHGVVTGVEVTPTNQTITADDTLQYTATAHDADGNTWDVTNTATWTVTDPTGSISANGLYDAGLVGTWAVTADLGSGIVGNTSVTVEHGELATIVINPLGPVNMTADDTQAFVAYGYDADGNKWDITADVTWNQNDPLGSFTGNVYNAGLVGSWTVNATYLGQTSNDVTVNVSHGVEVSIEITPVGPLNMTADDTQLFDATATDADGNTWNITASADWYENDPAGYFFGNLYNAGTVGIWQVWAGYNALTSNIVDITVTHGVATGLTVTPVDQTITADDTLQYTATANDADGNTWDITNLVTWSEDDTRGAITTGGLYSAGTTGTHNIGATYGALNDSTTVNVTHGVATRIIVVPGTATNVAGTNRTYNVRAYDADNNWWQVTSSSTLTIDPAAGFWTGTNNNILNTRGAGTWIVTGNYLAFSDTATITITPAALDHIEISPNTDQTITAGNTIQFIATGYDQYGNVRSGDIFTWDNTDTNGLFENTLVGIYPVQAHSGVFHSNIVNVTVNPGQTTLVVISPNTTQNIIAGADINFVATAYDAYGNLTNDTIIWTGTSAVDSGLFNNRIMGSYSVWATANGVDSTHVTVNVDHNVTTQILINPEITQNIIAGTDINFTAIAIDAYDNPTDEDVIWTGTSAVDSGLFNNRIMGTYTVWATANGVQSTHVTVNVDHNVTTNVVINPNTTQNIIAGDTVAFSAIAYDAYDNPTGDTITWTGTDGNGLFSETTMGSYTVWATANGINSIPVTVNVDHNVTTNVVINPNTEQIVVAGNNFTFTAIAYDNYGNPTGDAITWTGAVGGLFYEETAADYTVYATANGIDSTHVTVHVVPAALHHIEITPNTDQTITAGTTIQFDATGYDQYNNARTGDVFTWDNTDTNGLFTNTLVGTYPVQAHSGLIDSNIVNVIVNHNVATSITIDPTAPSITNAGDTVTFTVTAHDDYGNSWDVTSGASFTMSDTNAGSLLNNVYTGKKVGTGNVITVSYKGLTTSTSSITVTNPGEAVSIEIVNKISELNVAGTHQYQFIIKDAYGNVINASVSWNILAGSGATIDESGILTGDFAGNVRVQVIYNGLTDFNDVNIVVVGGIGGFVDNTGNTGSGNTTLEATGDGATVLGEDTEEGKVSSISTENTTPKNNYLIFILILIALALLFLGYNLANAKDENGKSPKKVVKTA